MKNATLEPQALTPLALGLRAVSVGFLYPDAAWRGRFPMFLAQARDKAALPKADLRGLEKAFAASAPDELEADHFRLFGPAAACTLDIAHHMTPNPFAQAKRLADIGGFFKAFGVETGGRNDSVPVLLEFAAYLEIKRALAHARGWKDRERTTREAAGKFARELLAPGLARFAAKLKNVDAPDIYIKLAECAKTCVGGIP